LYSRFLIYKQNPNPKLPKTDQEGYPSYYPVKEISFLDELLEVEEEVGSLLFSHPVTKAFIYNKWQLAQQWLWVLLLMQVSLKKMYLNLKLEAACLLMLSGCLYGHIKRNGNEIVVRTL